MLPNYILSVVFIVFLIYGFINLRIKKLKHIYNWNNHSHSLVGNGYIWNYIQYSIKSSTGIDRIKIQLNNQIKITKETIHQKGDIKYKKM